MATSYVKEYKYNGHNYTIDRNDADFGDKFRAITDDVTSPRFPTKKQAVEFAKRTIRGFAK